MENRLKINFKNRKLLIVPVVIAVVILLYFYLGNFFQTGVDYYGSFLREDRKASSTLSSVYVGKSGAGKTTLKVTRMSQADKFVEVNLDGKENEYVLEASDDGESIRIFDAENALIYSGNLSVESGTLTNQEGEAVSYYTYRPQDNETYNETNPDPMLLVLMANRLNERYRGNLTMLLFAGLIALSMITDMIFPNFFFRLKNLKYKGDIEIPAMYRKMQKYSWFFTPVAVIILMIMAL